MFRLKTLRLKTLLCAAFWLLTLTAGLDAQNRLFLFPSGGSSNVTVLDANTLAPGSIGTGTVVGSPNTVKALGVPDGSKYYLIANNAVRTITIVSASNLAAPQYLNLGANASAAVLSPDGKKLLVTAGTLKIYDVSNNNQLADIGVGSGPTDIEVSNDSRTAYILSTSAGLISVVNLAANPPSLVTQIAVVSPLSMAMRPDNKYLMVLVPNGISLIALKNNTLQSTIPVANVSNGRILSTPDSTRAIIINRGFPPLNVSQVIDLSTTNSTQIGGSNQAFNDIGVVDNSTAFALLTDNTVARIDLTTGGATVQSYGTNTRGIDIAPNGKTVYLASFANGNVVKVDVANNTTVNQTLGVPPTGVSAFFPPPTTGAITMTLNGGDRQNLVAGISSVVPLSVLVKNADGFPVFNAPVTFSTSAPGVTFDPVQPSRTNLKGIAQVFVTSGSSSNLRSDEEAAASPDTAASPDPVDQAAQITVTATTPGAPAVTFNLTQGSGAGIQIISGDGQITLPNQPFAEPLVVQVTDTSGFPVPAGTIVRFQASNAIPLLQELPTDAEGFARATCQGGQSTCFRGFLPQGFAAAPTNIFVSVTNRTDLGTATFNLQTLVAPPTWTDRADGDGQIGDTGTRLPSLLCVQINAPLQLAGPLSVRWTVVDGPAGANSATFDPAVVLTGSTACTTVTLGPLPGVITVRPVAPGVTGTAPTFTLTATGGPPSRIDILQGNNQQGNAGSVLPVALRVQVINAAGRGFTLPSTLYPLTFTVDPPEAATLSAFFQQPDGQASVLVSLGNRIGPFKVIATAGTVTATFNLQVITNAANLTVLSGNNQRVAVGGVTGDIVLRVIDNINNNVPNVPVTVRADASTVTIVPAQGASGNPVTITSDSDGRIRFTARAGAGTPVGQFTITASFSLGGRSGSTTVTVFVDGPKPAFTVASVVSAASFAQGLSPYGLGTLFGTSLSQVTGIEQPGGVTTYKGVTLKVDGVAAPLYLVSNFNGTEQINFHIRSDLVPGTRVRVELTNNGSTTAVDGVLVLRAQPGIFEYIPSGSNLRYAAAIKLDGSVIGPNNRATRGSIIAVFFTGGGVTNPLLQSGQAGPTPPATTFLQPTVGLGGGGVEVLFSGIAPGFVGLYQINIRIPDNAPTGDSVALVIIMDNTASQDSRIAIQ